jgi:O-antigen/teichoic acid export membrane protein
LARSDDRQVPEAHGGQRSFVRNLIWAVGGRGGAIAAGFGATALLTRLLSPYDLGIYYLILAVALTASPVANLSLDEPAIRAIAGARGAGRPERAAAFARSSLRLAVLSSIGTGALILGIWYAARQLGFGEAMHSFMPAFLMALWTAVYAVEHQLVAILQGVEDIAAASAFDKALGRFLSFAVLLVLWLCHVHATLTDVLLAFIAAECIALAGAAFTAARILNALGPSREWIPTAELLRTTWTFMVQVVTSTAGQQCPIFILGALQSPAEVAVFGVATRLSALLNTPGVAANVPLAPAIARLVAQGKRQELQTVLQFAALGPTLIAIAAIAWWSVGGHGLLVALFGPPYGAGTAILLILSVSQGIGLYFGPSLLTLSMGGEQALATKISLVSALAQIVAMVPLIAFWGAEGAAMSVLLVTFVSKAWGWWAVHRCFGVWSQADFAVLGRHGRQIYAAAARAAGRGPPRGPHT